MQRRPPQQLQQMKLDLGHLGEPLSSEASAKMQQAGGEQEVVSPSSEGNKRKKWEKEVEGGKVDFAEEGENREESSGSMPAEDRPSPLSNNLTKERQEEEERIKDTFSR